MNRRSDHRDETRPFSPKELDELRKNLSGFSVEGLRSFYEKTHQDCRMIFNRIPTPKQIQTLVQAWKQLRKER